MSDRIEKITRRLKKCFELVLADVKIGDMRAASMETVGEWTSLTTLMLVGSVEEEFGVTIGFDRLAELKSFAAFQDLLVARLNTGVKVADEGAAQG